MLLGMILVVLAGLGTGLPADSAEDWFAGGTELLADYDSELRGSDGRLDVDAMVARLSELRVDTYMYLIWHAGTDWEDLKRFLPVARAAGIDVWAYLVPPTESPPNFGTNYSEPFRLDYLRWALEIGSLSLQEPNLKAFVIDDFYANRGFFTPDYVGRMRQRGLSMNPAMRFFPLMYYPEMDADFIQDYGDVIDGVVAAYPSGEGDIRSAWSLLNDRLSEPERWSIVYPWNTASNPGYYGAMRRRFGVQPDDAHAVTLSYRDDYTGPTAGYHYVELLADGVVVWSEDVAGGTRDWRETTVDLDLHVAGRDSVEVAFRVYDRKGVSNFGVDVEVQRLTTTGLSAGPDSTWQKTANGPFGITIKPAYTGQGRFHLPLVVMIAASPGSFVKRNGEPGTAERYGQKLRMALTEMRRGQAEGVVTYTLPKYTTHDYYQETVRLYTEFLTPPTADFNADGHVDFADFIMFALAYGSPSDPPGGSASAYDLDLDGQIGFGDFLAFAAAYGRQG